ncbi:MAG: penicillin-binding protein [Propionibacteriaceae bacterium]|nr:penicillin-binding protein [Propionibacteriaceae bacterium]
MQKNTRAKKLSAFGMMVGISALAGVLVAGLAIPAAALTGVMSTVVSTSLSELPLSLLTPPAAERTTVYTSTGDVLAQFYDENRIIVELSDIAETMQKAQVAIEDDRFYEHGALDFRALAKAGLSYFSSDSGGGGSTLTQQYVKQVLMEEAVKIRDPELRAEELEAVQARTLGRKVTEMRHAIAIENKFTKDEILGRYLNIAYYGDGAYGVEAAAHHYFGTTAAELTLGQSALLAGIVQTPSRNPVDDLSGALERRDVVLDRMVELEIITAAEAEQAKLEVFNPEGVTYVKNGCYGVKYSQVCWLVWRYLMNNEALGENEQVRADTVRRGGFEIETFFDSKKQDAAQKAVSKLVSPKDPVLSAMLLMEPGTGHVVAAAQNRHVFGDDASLGETQWLSFALPEYGGDQGQQPGSIFKVFTAAAALEEGIPPTKMIDARSSVAFGGQTFKSCDGPFRVGPWNVVNASPSGKMDMRAAAAGSVNTYFVKLEQIIGICPVVQMADKVGVRLSSPTEEYPDILAYDSVASLTLGVIEISPMSIATAISTYAAQGIRCDPIIIKSIKDPTGVEVPTQQSNCHRAVSADVANGVNSVFSRAFSRGGTASGYGFPDGRAASGKTGTTDSGRAVWIVGWTPEVVGVAMIGVDPDPRSAKFWSGRSKSLAGLTLPDSGTRLGGYGGADAGRIWQSTMSAVASSYPKTEFASPSSSILTGKVVTPPSTSGMDLKRATQVLEDAGFFVSVSKIYDDQPANTLVNVSCEYIYGGTCTLAVSQGPRKQTPEPPPPPDEPGGG